MDYGTMYITATAANGKTCDIPVRIAAVSGGHEHTWVEKIEKIDFEHHGYTKCTDPACPGVAPAFDKDSQYAVHEFVGGCTEKCTTCGDLGNPNAKHNLKWIAVKPATCSTTGMNAHYKCEGCGKYFDEGKNETTEAALTILATGDHNYGAWVSNGNGTHTGTCTTCSHSETKNCSGGTATCENKAVCSVCGAEYGEKLGHDWNAWVSNGDGTHTRTCKRDSGHKENGTCSGGTATCTTKAVCDVCRTTYGDTAPHDYGELIPEVAATTTEFGVKEHKDCKVCGKHFDKDGNEITELKIAKIGTHNVIVNGESKFYKDGESVTVTANEPAEGKEFVGWKDASGKIVSTEKSYTFTVNGETTLTAVYEDKSSGGEITPPAKKDGLSGGQIAGIVIGTLLLAGIGGFAIFWFAVKKKTFADLGVALKKGFTAIGNFFKNLGAKIKALFTKKK